uniref:Uncharacterized protein n=1 Tax=Macrostomum lignano TaxID=282301 RepID=A0A1I8JRR1_9PLAT
MECCSHQTLCRLPGQNGLSRGQIPAADWDINLPSPSVQGLCQGKNLLAKYGGQDLRRRCSCAATFWLPPKQQQKKTGNSEKHARDKAYEDESGLTL